MKYIEEKSRSGIIHKKFTSAFGKKILEKFGWKEGEGLGKNKSGITDVIQVKRREENKGLGKEEKKENWNDKWWENTYDKVLKNIPKSEKRKDEDDIVIYFILWSFLSHTMQTVLNIFSLLQNILQKDLLSNITAFSKSE